MTRGTTAAKFRVREKLVRNHHVEVTRPLRATGKEMPCLRAYISAVFHWRKLSTHFNIRPKQISDSMADEKTLRRSSGEIMRLTFAP